MSLGNILIQPQKLNRSLASDEVLVVDLFLELANRLLRDALEEDGAAQQKIGKGLESVLQALEAEVQGRAEQASGKVRNWFQPLIEAVENSIDTNGLEGIQTMATALVNLLKETLEGLHSEQLIPKMNALIDLVEHDFGLSKSRILRLFNDSIDSIIDELTKDFLGGDTTEEAKNCFLIGSQISRLKLYLNREGGDLWPDLDRQQFVQDFVKFLKKKGWDDLIDKVLELLEKLQGAVGDLAENLGDSASDDAEVGTSSEDKQTRGFSRTDHGEGAVQMSWYASWFKANWAIEDYTKVSNRFALDQEPFATDIRFGGKMDAEFMEKWAHITTGVFDLLEASMHGLSIEKGDWVNNLTHGILQLFKGIFTLAGGDEKGEGWVKAFKAISISEYWGSFAITWATSWAKNPGSCGGWFYSALAPDQVEWMLYGIWTSQFRDFWLSLFTLINSDLDDKPTAKNHEHAWGFSMLFMEIGHIVAAFMPLAIDGKEHFGFDPSGDSGERFTNNLKKYGAYLGIAAGSSYLGALIGWLISGAICGGNFSKRMLLGDSWATVKILGYGILKWFMYYYLISDGDTNGGTLGQDGDKKIVRFPGYPEQASSPYLLPYAPEQMQQCVQGNHGIWSHNTFNSQVYAYDFDHNEGDEVLAMRGGIVQFYRDEVPNNNTRAGNKVRILHDDGDEGEIPNPKHDQWHLGVVSTRAVYLHGQHFGVRHAFARRGIPSKFITGSRVRQGDLVMYAGDTGMSQYNHLHVHIRPEPEPGAYIVSLPFVFRDADQKKLLGLIPLGTEGVLRGFDFYESQNTRKPSLEAGAIYQPEYHEGELKGCGINFIILDDDAQKDNDKFKDVHLFIKMMRSEGVFYQYKKIKEYIGSKRKAIIQGNWDKPHVPQAGDEYRIGARPYAQANSFNKNFAYLADRDNGGTAQNFDDGRSFDRLGLFGKYHAPAITGKVTVTAVAGTNRLQLDAAASTIDDAYNNRHLIVRKEGKIIQYHRIVDYIGSTKTVQVEGEWAFNLTANNHDYEIGQPLFAATSDDLKKSTFLGDKDNPETIAYTDFEGSKKPYTYFTYKMNWQP